MSVCVIAVVKSVMRLYRIIKNSNTSLDSMIINFAFLCVHSCQDLVPGKGQHGAVAVHVLVHKIRFFILALLACMLKFSQFSSVLKTLRKKEEI